MPFSNRLLSVAAVGTTTLAFTLAAPASAQEHYAHKSYAHTHYAYARHHHYAHEGRYVVVHAQPVQAPAPNPSYAWDACCPAGCGGTANNAACAAESITPPTGQPPAKSYKDFNANWPLDSWSVTEPSDGYQTAYIRLLSKFAN